MKRIGLSVVSGYLLLVPTVATLGAEWAPADVGLALQRAGVQRGLVVVLGDAAGAVEAARGGEAVVYVQTPTARQAAKAAPAAPAPAP